MALKNLRHLHGNYTRHQIKCYMSTCETLENHFVFVFYLSTVGWHKGCSSWGSKYVIPTTLTTRKLNGHTYIKWQMRIRLDLAKGVFHSGISKIHQIQQIAHLTKYSFTLIKYKALRCNLFIKYLSIPLLSLNTKMVFYGYLRTVIFKVYR